MARRVAAYLRKSKDAATKAEHLDRLLTAARADGSGQVEVYDDWARSGDLAKLRQRAEWRRLCEDIEADQVGAVYMNDLDRGGRSLEEWLRFVRVAIDHGVRVIAGGIDYSLSENRDRLVLEAWIAERELDAAKRRAAETVKMRRRRGDQLGQAAYGMRQVRGPDGRVTFEVDEAAVQVLRDVMNETDGNVPAAVRLLNERAVPSRFGRTWSWHNLTAALRRHGLLPPATRRARKSHGRLKMPSPLAKLVRCHCGQLMTPTDGRKEAYCWVGARKGVNSDHGRYLARQRHIWDALRSAVDSTGVRIAFNPPVDAAEVAEKRKALEDRLRRLGRAYADGGYTDEEYEAEAEAIKRDLADLRDADADGYATEPLFGPLVDWDADPATVGVQLRRLVREVVLGKDMRPAEVVLR